MSNKIIIDSRNNDVLKKVGHNGPVAADRGIATVSAQNTIPIPLYEDVWGNDRVILDKLDEGLLADRKLFVRIRHIQKVTCRTEYEDIAMEPVTLDEPLKFMIVDLSAGGIGVICEHEIRRDRIFGITILLDGISYDIKCQVAYCIQIDGKFRAGLKIAQKERHFMRHLKIFVARISLTSQYACGE